MADGIERAVSALESIGCDDCDVIHDGDETLVKPCPEHREGVQAYGDPVIAGDLPDDHPAWWTLTGHVAHTDRGCPSINAADNVGLTEGSIAEAREQDHLERECGTCRNRRGVAR